MRERLDAVGARRGAEEELIKKGRSADEHKKKRLDAKKELLSLVRELESERARTRQTVSDAGETLSRISVQVALVRNLQVNVIEQLHGLGILDPEAVPSGGGVMASRKGRRTGDTAEGDGGAIFGPVNGECGLLGTSRRLREVAWCRSVSGEREREREREKKPSSSHDPPPPSPPLGVLLLSCSFSLCVQWMRLENCRG